MDYSRPKARNLKQGSIVQTDNFSIFIFPKLFPPTRCKLQVKDSKFFSGEVALAECRPARCKNTMDPDKNFGGTRRMAGTQLSETHPYMDIYHVQM